MSLLSKPQPQWLKVHLHLPPLCLCASFPCPCSPEPPGTSLCHRELFRPSAQRIRQQQSVFFWSQRSPPLPAGSSKTRSNRQPAPGHHRSHEGKELPVLTVIIQPAQLITVFDHIWCFLHLACITASRVCFTGQV